MRTSLVVFALVVSPPPAAAQAPPDVTFRVTAGHDTFGFRDVAKSKPPFDASPIEWRGGGPIVTFDYARRRPLRLHRFEASVASSGDFTYETGVGTVARPPEDEAGFLEGQYDYRRYLARDLLVGGLHAGVGVRGIGERRVLRHHFGGNVALTETDLAGSIAVVAALRFRPSDRFGAELEWGNAATLAHSRQHHEADVVADDESWGGGWITDLTAYGDVRVTRHTAMVLSYTRRGEGRMFNHRAYASTRNRVMAGVMYAR